MEERALKLVEPEALAAKCPCGGLCAGDAVLCAIYVWKDAFFEAKREVKIDILKGKIHKAWGSQLDKEADFILEAMDVQWDALVSKEDFKNRFQSILKA